MAAKSLTSQQKRCVYVLPADTIKAQANGRAIGAMAAFNDYPRILLDRGAVEAQARAGCVLLKKSFTSRPLTNDFPLFCELFIAQYMTAYLKDAQAYALSEETYLENKQGVERIGGPIQAYHLIVEDYVAGQEARP